MPFFLLFMLFFSPQFALAPKPPSPESLFSFGYEGPLAGLNYRSSLSNKNPYYEEFRFSEYQGVTTIILALRGETNTVRIGNDLNLIDAKFTKEGRNLSVSVTPDGLLYATNGVPLARYPMPQTRIVIFPEIQLRDFLFSERTNMSFVQLLTGDYRAASMVARKKIVTNIYGRWSSYGGAEGSQVALPIEVITRGLSPGEWAMVYYFDTTGWPVRKEGFFNAGFQQGNQTVFMIPNNDTDLYYLGTPSYTADLITKVKYRGL